MADASAQATSKRTALVVGLTIFLLFALGQAVWIVLDQWPVASDPVSHYRFVQKLHHALNNAPGELLPFSNDFPPLLFLVALVCVQLFGLTADVAILSGLVFSLVLFVGTYGLARRWLHRPASLAAATLVLVFPGNLVLSRLFFTDYAQGALVALAMALLVRRRVFHSPFRAVLMGLALGAGMLIKWTFPIFLAVPLLIRLLVPVGAGSVRTRGNQTRWGRQRFAGLAICLGVAGLVALPWYLANPRAISSRFALATVQNPTNLPGGFRLDLFYYPERLPFMVSLPGLLLCAVGFWWMIKRSKRGALFLLGAVLPATLFLSLMPAHWPRYLVPVLPALAVLAAAWLPSRARWRPALILVALSLTWATVYSFSPVADNRSRCAGLFFPGPAHLELDLARPAIAPRRWVSSRAVDQVFEQMHTDEAEAVCFVVPYAHHDFNCHTLRYLAVERRPGIPLTFVPSFRGAMETEPRVEALLGARWVLHKPEAVYYSRAGLGPLDIRPTEGARLIMARLLAAFPHRFERRVVVPFSDGVEGALYRRHGDFSDEERELVQQTTAELMARQWSGQRVAPGGGE